MTNYFTVERPELSRDDLEEVLEHVLCLDGPPHGTIQRSSLDSHLCAHLPADLVLGWVILVVALEREFVDCVREVVSVPVITQVRYELVHRAALTLERATGGKVDIANDFVHANAAGDIAALTGLILELL
jgi:hypothetical protein